jgi:hypothetical protein
MPLKHPENFRPVRFAEVGNAVPILGTYHGLFAAEHHALKMH